MWNVIGLWLDEDWFLAFFFQEHLLLQRMSVAVVIGMWAELTGGSSGGWCCW